MIAVESNPIPATRSSWREVHRILSAYLGEYTDESKPAETQPGPGCFDGADEVFFFQPPNIGWDLGEVTAHMTRPAKVFNDLETLINRLVAESRDGDHILIMSNGGFGGIHDKLIARLKDYHGEL